MKAYIQHQDKKEQKLILQALVPFLELKDSVLFTYRANVPETSEDKHAQYQASMEFYQRRVDAKRSNDIKEFVKKSILLERSGVQMATLFPTSMILAMSEDEDDENGNKVERCEDGTCDVTINRNVFIVDGQHRMMGMIKLYDDLKRLNSRKDEDEYVFQYLNDYKFNCTILVNYDLWEQGQVFVNVNFKQKPVNKSLYYEIFGAEYSEDSSDWERNKVYLAHKMVKMLNERKESPFYLRIKMLGTGDGYVSQAFVVESLMRHFKKGGLWYFDQDKCDDTTYFGTELLSFFVAIKKLFPTYWPAENETKGTLICKTTGVGAWIRLMGNIRSDNDTALLMALKDSASDDMVCMKYVDRVCAILAPLQKNAERLFGEKSVFKSSSGQGSESKLYKTMLSLLSNPDISIAEEAKAGCDVGDILEQIQEYVWTNPIDDLDPLSHHYDVEDIANFRLEESHVEGNKLLMKATFGMDVSLYMDNEEDSGFSMAFPAECEAEFEKKARGYVLIPESVKVSVDTEEYYK